MAEIRRDNLGFPIPASFDPTPVEKNIQRANVRPKQPGSTKRFIVLLIMTLVVVPAVLAPTIIPKIRLVVVRWSVNHAKTCEARNDLEGAIAGLDRAIAWQDRQRANFNLPRLLSMRAMLRLENRDKTGALEDANEAIAQNPQAIEAYRVRAMVRVCLDDPEGALKDAERVLELSPESDLEALNHRAYIRALVQRELLEALKDVDRAIALQGDPSAEILDTRGYILHLLGKHQEAIDEMNFAIDTMQQFRRQNLLLAKQMNPIELARRLRSIDHGLAVMLHHRALACKAAGFVSQAEQDFEIARQKGFDPSRGIF